MREPESPLGISSEGLPPDHLVQSEGEIFADVKDALVQRVLEKRPRPEANF